MLESLAVRGYGTPFISRASTMPARLFNQRVRPQRLRTFLILFALALTIPLLGLGIFALNRMALGAGRDRAA